MNTRSDEICEIDFEDVLKTTSRVFVLFYASGCPFSQRFLPIFEECTRKNPTRRLKLKIDDKAWLCEKYSMEVFPTVLLFENGKVARRLDGAPSAGLSEEQLKNLLGVR